MKQIDSRMFGKTMLLEDGDSELTQLTDLILKYPVNAFGTVNKLFNSKGFVLIIDIREPNKVS